MQTKLAPFAEHNLNFTPGGIFKYVDGEKIPVDLKRYDNLNWVDYPKDNIGRIKLPPGIVVLDLDKVKSTIVDNSITIPALDLTLPLGLYSQTSRENAYHIYYSITAEQQASIGGKFIKSLHDLKVDILQNSIVFEAHSFSPHNEIHSGSIDPIPAVLLDSILEHNSLNNLKPQYAQEHLALHSNIQRYNLVQAYLAEKPMRTTAKNSLIKSITPHEYHKVFKDKRKFAWKFNELSYDLINKMAVKLATTRELDYHEHLVPTLHKILTEFDIDPNSRLSRQELQKIMVGLPQHQSLTAHQQDDDNRSFQQLIEAQPNTDYPVFRTIHMGKKRFVRVCKFSLKPVPYNNEYLLEEQAIKILNTERQQYSEDGKPTYWDETDLPIVEIIEDPYQQGFTLDSYSRHCINLSPRSRFVEEVQAQVLTTTNIFYRVMESTVHPDYLATMLYYHAHILFSPASPIMIPWAASGEITKGGSGKSMITITILTKILGPLAAQVDLKKLASGFDMTSGVKLLTLEDSETDVGPQWNAAYAVMKQLQSAAYTKVNPKYGKDLLKKIKVSITGSSNDLPRLAPSDRRILCLEPAHLHGDTEPLNEAEQETLAEFERDEQGTFDVELQAYVNHLYAMYVAGTPQSIKKQLYQTVEHTKYRQRWTVSAVNNTKGITLTLPIAEEFLATVYEDRITPRFFGLIQHLLEMYSEDEQKVALSWKWFADIIPFIAADPDITTTKKSVLAMLGNPYFASGSGWAQTLLKASSLGTDWPLSVYTFNISSTEIELYRAYLKAHTTQEGEINL